MTESPTVAARWGTGGNNVPIVQHTIQPLAFEPGSIARNAGPADLSELCPTLRANMGDNQPAVIALAENTIGRQPMNGGNGDGFTVGGPMCTLNATGVHGVMHESMVPSDTFKIRGQGHYTGAKGGEVKSGGGGCGYIGQDELAYTVATTQDQYLMQCDPKAFSPQSGGDLRGLDLQDYPSLQRCQVGGVLQSMAVRRLTPMECERLQGFPDGWTDIDDNTPDSPRYKAIGNSMAVPVMRWIGERINEFR